MIANIDGSRKLEGEMDEVAKVTDNRKQFFCRTMVRGLINDIAFSEALLRCCRE